MNKQKLDMKIFKKLFKYLAKYKFKCLIVFICIIANAIVQAISQLFLKNLIDDYISPLLLMDNPVYTALLHFIGFMGLIYLFGIVCGFIYNRLMVTVAQGVLKDIRDDMFNHMQTLPISYFDTNSHGDIMSRYTNDTDTLEQVISRGLPMITSSVFSIITIFVSMLTLNIPLTFLVLVGVLTMSFIVKNISKKTRKYFVSQQESIGKLDGFIEEMTDGVKVIKVFNHEEISLSDFDKLNEELFLNSSIANGYGNMIGPVTNNVGYMVYVIIAIFGGIIAIKSDAFTLGAITSFLSLTHSFTRPIMQITHQFNTVIMAMAGAGRILNLLEEKPEENKGTVKLVNVKKVDGKLKEVAERTNEWAWKKGRELIPLKGDVRITDVSFGYLPDKEVIHHVSLYAKPGQKIAFVGSTGAGKTTITNLLNRFYDIKKGTITYDGIDIKEIDKRDLRRSLGMVLQDTNLFTGTIMDNIRYGNMEATDSECIEAAKLANAHDFIELLPDGYNTVISGNGANLSGGQRQLLAIARCALNNPPVMILDEATSSIDTRTEKIVQDGMDKLMEGRTVFVIAHRLSTVRNAKAIMVMEHGEIIERGDHDTLIKEKGRYYSLYTGASILE